jgi:hypothetical protein
VASVPALRLVLAASTRAMLKLGMHVGMWHLLVLLGASCNTNTP